MTDEDETSDFDLPIDREALVRAAERGELPGALLPLVRVDRKHLADTLVTLHEGASVDVLEAFSAAALGDVEQHDFFFLMMLFAEMLPKIDADQAIVMTLTAGLVDRAGENGAAGTPYSAFRAWCAHDDTRPISVLAAIESAPQARGRFTQLALEAGAMQDPTRYVAEALRLVDHDEPPVHLGALSALGTADLTEQPGLEEVVLAALRRQIDGSADPAVVTNALGALFERCLAAGERRLSTLRQVVQRRPDTPSPLEQQVYARALATHGATLPSELLDALLYRLRRLDRQYGGIIQYLDTALSQYRDAIGIERTSRSSLPWCAIRMGRSVSTTFGRFDTRCVLTARMGFRGDCCSTHSTREVSVPATRSVHSSPKSTRNGPRRRSMSPRSGSRTRKS